MVSGEMWEGSESIQRFIHRMVSEFGEPVATSIARALCEEIGGQRISMPSLSTLERLERNRQIRQAFNGRNYRELALQYGLDERQIRRIVCGHKPKGG
ncbi:MAG: hypothetical protein Tsb0017_27780 [Geothermobacteraceae bacterium]